MIKSKNYSKVRLLISLYLNYFVHGFGLVILSQNMGILGEKWNVSLKMVSFLMSGIGLGRLVSYPVMGRIATIINKKTFLYIGMISYSIFAVGVISVNNFIGIYLCIFFAGIANSALDAGTYPMLVEMSTGEGEKTIIIKIFMSLGEFFLPLIVTFLVTNKLWFGWSFVIMVALLMLNIINVASIRIPRIQENKVEITVQNVEKKKIISTVLLLIYGYTSMAMMIWFTQWITIFAKQFLRLTEEMSHMLLSLYSLGSIMGVVVLYCVLQRYKHIHSLLVLINMIPIGALAVILCSENILVIAIACLLFGGSAASGVMQLGLVIFMKIYPKHRSLVTSAFYFFGSIASFTIKSI